jgi:anti-anti-sigma regulatory factor
MGKLSLEDKADEKELRAEGRMNIQDAAQLKDLLMEVYHSSNDLCIDLAGAESMDLACMQVLCSANWTFRKEGRRVCISGMLPEGVRKSLEEIGIDPKGCALEASMECLWLTGAGDE